MSGVHLLVRDNGAGMSRDLHLLAHALRQGGSEPTVTAIGRGVIGRRLRHARLRAQLAWAGRRIGPLRARFELNLMVERIWPEFLSLAWRNVLVPNPEWFRPEFAAHLRRIDQVFAKTRHAVALFDSLGCNTTFVGFTSVDRLDAAVEREPGFLHLAGRSRNKGTQPLVDLWLRHPQWPTLTIVQRGREHPAQRTAANLVYITRYLEDAELRTLQNRHRFHLCPSETEGFGHHLVEGMSTGAVVLATDAPPMNELVDNQRGVLVAYRRTGIQRLATTYHVDADTLEPGVERMLGLGAREQRMLGANARDWWQRNDRDFQRRLLAAIAADTND